MERIKTPQKKLKVVKKYTLLGLLMTIGCVSNYNRSPSSLNNLEVHFNIQQSDSVQKNNLKFELVNLFELKSNFIEFKSYFLNHLDSGKALLDWQAQLKSFLSLLNEDIIIKINNKNFALKTIDLQRLDRVLDLIDKNREISDLRIRKKIEIINAFNQNLKTTSIANLTTLNIPIFLSKKNEIKDFIKIELAANSLWHNSSPSKIENLKNENFENFNDQCDYSNTDETTKNPLEFTISCKNVTYNINLHQNARSAVFNSLLYQNLGYNTSQFRFVYELKIKYDRNLILKFNKLTPFLSLKKKKNQAVRELARNLTNDNFSRSNQVILKNGEKISAEEALMRLLPFCKDIERNCHFDETLYDSKFEKEIDYLLLKNIAIAKEQNNHVFGHWNYDDLDYANRTEVKSLLFVGAFTGNWNLQKESNLLLWSGHNFEIIHQINNLGAGFGRGITNSVFDLNAMHWEILRKKGDSVLIDFYKPNINPHIFSKISFAEARWIVRKIAALSEDQLTLWLAKSGFNAAELLLAREKLISIQKNMVETFNLNSEFIYLNNRKINKNLNFRPRGDSEKFELKNGAFIIVENNGFSIKNGFLKSDSF